jgi:hypothetical protein
VFRLVRFVCAIALFAHLTYGMTAEERREYLQKLQQILPDVPSFQSWLRQTGELPPDFDTFPRVNGLLDPFTFLDGRPVRAPQEWRSRRAEIRQLFEKYHLGSFPPKPKLDHIVLVDETPGKGYLVRNGHHARNRFAVRQHQGTISQALKRLGCSEPVCVPAWCLSNAAMALLFRRVDRPPPPAVLLLPTSKKRFPRTRLPSSVCESPRGACTYGRRVRGQAG